VQQRGRGRAKFKQLLIIASTAVNHKSTSTWLMEEEDGKRRKHKKYQTP
jgi:hypothetical protein